MSRLMTILVLGGQLSATQSIVGAPPFDQWQAQKRACRTLLQSTVGRRIETTSAVSLGKAGWEISYRGCGIDVVTQGEAEMKRGNDLFGYGGVFAFGGVLQHRPGVSGSALLQGAPDSFFLALGKTGVERVAFPAFKNVTHINVRTRTSSFAVSSPERVRAIVEFANQETEGWEVCWSSYRLAGSPDTTIDLYSADGFLGHIAVGYQDGYCFLEMQQQDVIAEKRRVSPKKEMTLRHLIEAIQAK